LFRRNIKYSSSEILLFGRMIINSADKQTFLAEMTKWHTCRTYG